MTNENNSTNIKYPDTLVKIWEYFHGNKNAFSTKKECCDEYQKVEKLCKDKKKINGFKLYEPADFLIELFSGICPSNIHSEAVLYAKMRKFLTKNGNPMGYELNKILREALLQLEKKELIIRDSKESNSLISSNKTFFSRKDNPDAPYVNNLKNYERNKDSIPKITVKIRANSLEKTRIIPRSTACDLIMHLLNAFEGKTNLSLLQEAAMNHIPDQMIVGSMDKSLSNDEDHKTTYADFIPSSNEESYIEELDNHQICIYSDETAEKIWDEVCKIQKNRFFCLYNIPKKINIKSRLEDFGKTSTMSDIDKKIDKIWKDAYCEISNKQKVYSLDDIQESQFLSKRQKRGLNEISHRILEQLIEKCTENGYNPDLSSLSTLP